MAPECEREASTQHYLGEGHGFGIITPEEFVLLAIFEKDDHDREAGEVSQLTFDRDLLKHDNMSLARRRHTPLAVFRDHVVSPGEAGQKGKLVGVAMAETSAIQSLTFLLMLETPLRGRQACLLDIVLPGDDDGHATLGYSESQRTMVPEKHRSKLREKIHRDLADAFGRILPIHSIPFQT